MGVAGHLRIRLDEYDARIRSFIPGYDEMLDAAANALRALDVSSPHIVDLGTGTGALASACARIVPRAALTVVDSDGEILDMARSRLSPLAIAPTFVHASFPGVALPAADAVVSSLALHHIRNLDDKQRLYNALYDAIAPNGLLVLVDCYPSSDARIAQVERAAWHAHLRRSYSDLETTALFAAWAEEDSYVPLTQELAMLSDASFAVNVVWRRDCFAVIAGRRTGAKVKGR